jgi:hypothetical protein
MLPRLTHRRSRRRSRLGRIIVLAVILLVVALLIGGFTQIGPRSGPFNASVNRSFAAQGAVLVAESNATGALVRRVMGDMQTQVRQQLESELDAYSTQAGQQAARAALLLAPHGVQGQFVSVFSTRAQAVGEVHTAVDGLLGMHPLAVSGAPGATATAKATTATLLSSTQATDQIAAAGKLLVRADHQYRAVRHSLAHLAGHAKLPASQWITHPDLWQVGAVATQVDLVVSSTTLAVTHRLVLRAVQITPPALPSSTAAVSVLTPTTQVGLNVVLSNLGSVDEPHVKVTFSLAPLSAGAAHTVTRSTGVVAGGSVSLSPVSFPVKPASSYQLTVAIEVPAGQTDAVGTALGEVLQIAPST